VFSRKAAPLFLPKLDDYLAALPPPRFIPLPSNDKDKDMDVGIFRPMDRLVSSGKTLEDLETNTGIPPFWKNRQTILGGLVNIFLGIMVRQIFPPLAIIYITGLGIQCVGELLQLAGLIQHSASLCFDIEHHWYIFLFASPFTHIHTPSNLLP
jgi:hypothetical protein